MFQQQSGLKLNFNRLELNKKIKESKAKHVAAAAVARKKLLSDGVKLLEVCLAKAKQAQKSGKTSKNDQGWANKLIPAMSQRAMGAESHEKAYTEIIEMLSAAT